MKIDDLFKQKIKIAQMELSLAEKEDELYQLCRGFEVMPIAAADIVMGRWFNAAAIGINTPKGSVSKIKEKLRAIKILKEDLTKESKALEDLHEHVYRKLPSPK